jgi:hypothetical protein
VTDDSLDLHEHRGMAAQKATEIRRRHNEIQAVQAALLGRQAEFEVFLLTAPAATWPAAAAKARYLLQLFATTQDAQNSRHQQLIAAVLADFTRLSV